MTIFALKRRIPSPARTHWHGAVYAYSTINYGNKTYLEKRTTQHSATGSTTGSRPADTGNRLIFSSTTILTNKASQDMSKRKQVVTFEAVRDKIVKVRGQQVILDYAVADLYGVETREINQAVKNNPNKFPKGWLLELNSQESAALRSNILMLEQGSGKGRYSKHNYKAFTERGLYMLATILKGEKATETTIAIVETFAKLRELSNTLGEMIKNPDEYQQKSLMQKSNDIMETLFGDALATDETETEIELNFAVLKLKHTIKRKK